MENFINKLNHFCTKVEKGFNVAGCIPYVGIVSGNLRAALGKVQCVAGIILLVSGKMGQIGAKMQGKSTREWDRIMLLGAEHTVHGALNVLRGLGEALLGIVTLGVGNILLLAPNMMNKDEFGPYVPYGSVKDSLQRNYGFA